MRKLLLAAIVMSSCASVEPVPPEPIVPIVQVQRCRYDPFAEGPGIGAHAMIAAMAIFVPSGLRRLEVDRGVRELVCDDALPIDGRILNPTFENHFEAVPRIR